MDRSNSTSRFLAFAERLFVFFFDQFGVLHDGRLPYPGAVEALMALKGRRAQIVILSNSGRSGLHNASRMERIGFGRDLYDHFVTSGDVAKSLLLAGKLPVAMGSTTRCLTISTTGEHDLADELGLTNVTSAADADLLLISGSQTDRLSMDEYAALMAPAAANGAVCVCTNPDKLMLSANHVRPGAGAIAALFEKLGGKVIWVGKPSSEMYQRARSLVEAPEASKILCVGDSPEHDIAGAHQFGAVAALVRTGILASLSEAEITIECAAHGVVPDVILPGLN